MSDSKLFKKLAHNPQAIREGYEYFDGLRKNASKLREVARFAAKHPHITSAAAGGAIEGTMDAMDTPSGYKWLAFKRGLKRGAVKGGLLSLAVHELPKHASGFRDVAGNALDRAKNLVTANKTGLIGGAIGAAGMAGAAYLSSKKSKRTGDSAEQRTTQAALKQITKEETDMQSKGVEPHLGHKLKKVFGRTSADIADILSDHPKLTAVAAMPAGYAAGSFLAGKASKLFKK